MYFQEFDNLNKAFYKAKLVLIPTLKTQLATLYENSNNLGDEEQNQGLFSIITVKLKSDVDTVLRLVDQLLFPVIEQIIGCINNKHPIQSFDMLRMYHQRCVLKISELRSLCNNYVTNPNWSNSKRNVCMNLFQLEQSLLAYINFMENSIFTLLIPSNDSQLFAK
jgi:iron-sulfur cluster repair protein YtfE (RIC family)